MPTLTTDRVRLRPWRPDDVDFAFDLYSRDEVQRYLGRTPTTLTHRDQAAEKVRRWMALDHPIHRVWAIERRTDGALLGTLLLKGIPASGRPDAEPSDTEIGWHLHPQAWGHGYASEAALAGLAHAWDSGLDRIVAVTHPENTASQAVATRIGMRHLGLSDAYYDMTCALFEATAPPASAGQDAQRPVKNNQAHQHNT